MKVLIVNASPHRNGNTSIALEEMVKVFRNEGVETELLNIGTQCIRGCIACGSCATTGKCVFDDQTTPNMIQRISRIFERNPLISKEI